MREALSSASIFTRSSSSQELPYKRETAMIMIQHQGLRVAYISLKWFLGKDISLFVL